MSSNPEIFDLVGLLQSNWNQNCYSVVLSCILIYDCILTFAREVELMWGRKFSCVTLLFFSNRWLTILWSIGVIMQLYPGITNKQPPSFGTTSGCSAWTDTGYAISVAMDINWMCFSVARIYAVGGGGWKLPSAVFALTLLPTSINAWVEFKLSSSAVWEVPRIGSWLTPCILATVIDTTCYFASDAIVLCVTWHKTYALKREADQYGIRIPLVTLLLRDGTGYFMYAFRNSNRPLGCLLHRFQTLVMYTRSHHREYSVPEHPGQQLVQCSILTRSSLSSLCITHFLCDLRQIAYGPRDDGLDSRPSFVNSQPSISPPSRPASPMLASFIDNIGEQLVDSHDSQDADMAWETPEHVEAEDLTAIGIEEASNTIELVDSSENTKIGNDSERMEFKTRKIAIECSAD
ncbi:hypothetical protein CERSUDRAFT_77180 [Gelatoporia subvermispora B]|uniref:DUF6533 domain-containing protein n=1 Tax=Ceriporiopsis subvermispora (strain B) TaxID=914234 RepID=M2PB68_CERS8|nr:hypothetical protein CERSUDRAFT_77180 [Gelatoporia subvermispora B]